MKTVPLSEAKAKLSSLVDQIATTDEQVVITRNGVPAAVLVSPEEFEGWTETSEILSDAAFMREIKAGLKALNAKKAKRYSLDELLKELA